jgi:hypothetical protein
MKFIRNTVAALGIGLSVLAASVLALSPAFAQSTTLDQIPIPLPGAGNTTLNSEALIQSYPVTGGTLYYLCSRGPGRAITNGNAPNYGCTGPTFVPTNLSGSFTRYLSLSDARLDTGIISVSATGTSTAYGIARTAGTSYDLIGAATSSNAVTTKAMWETNIASTYVAGTAIPIVVNANYTGSGTITGASTTLTVAAYTEVGGVETALTGITAAQQFTGTAANYSFSIPSTAGLVPGQHITVEVVMLVTTASGANTGQINSVGVTD